MSSSATHVVIQITCGCHGRTTIGDTMHSGSSKTTWHPKVCAPIAPSAADGTGKTYAFKAIQKQPKLKDTNDRASFSVPANSNGSPRELEDEEDPGAIEAA